MSDTNYEFLLYNRPIILLANEWLMKVFPDIGIKTDLNGLEDAINESIDNPKKFEKERQKWLEKTIYKPDTQSSKRVLKTAIEYANIKNPIIAIVHDNCQVKKANLLPLYNEAKKRGYDTEWLTRANRYVENAERYIFFAAHFENLNIDYGYKVHLDHALKGQGTANVEYSKMDYKKNNFFPKINLNITAGNVGQERTRMLLGPNADRAVIAGYPKADDLLRLNTKENRNQICKELGFDPKKPIITYAPAGKESYVKPGGSLSNEVIKKLEDISAKYDYNVLIKLKFKKENIACRGIKKARSIVRKLRS